MKMKGSVMRARDLRIEDLLEVDAREGVRFAGERALILDAVAMGLLRKQLVETLGLTGARAVLTRFGFAHGWRMAEALRTGFKWKSEAEWRDGRSAHPHAAGTGPHPAGGQRSALARRASPWRTRTRRSSTCCTWGERRRPCAGRCAASPAAT